MNLLIEYIFSFLSKKRYYPRVSLLSFWNKYTHFGRNVLVSYGSKLNNCELGKYTRIRNNVVIHSCKIGAFTCIGRDCRINLAEHPTNLLSINSLFYEEVPNAIRNDWVREIDFQSRKPVTIGNDVWIGEFSSILSGITIGDGAIVAARSVVTKNVPPYAIVAGVPAVIKKYRFNDEIIECLLKLKWWNLSDDLIEKNLSIFTETKITKEKLLEIFN